MAKNHYLNRPSSNQKVELAPRDVVRREFGKRLQEMLRERGWKQSELARRMYGTTTDSQGRTVAKGRDNVSGWVRGRVLPYDDAMDKLCRVLNVTRDDLLPYELIPNTDRDVPAFEARAVGPDSTWLRINQRVTNDQFVRIVQILQEGQGR